MLETDRSTAVRLAIVETISDSGMVQQVEQQLLDALLVQDNALVQFKLVAMINQQGSQTIQQKLLTLSDDDRLHEDVKQDLFKNNESQSI